MIILVSLGANLQAVDHPYLVVYSKTAAQKEGNLVDAHNSEQDCGICHEPVEDPVVSFLFLLLCSFNLLMFDSHHSLSFLHSFFPWVLLFNILPSNFNAPLGAL